MRVQDQINDRVLTSKNLYRPQERTARLFCSTQKPGSGHQILVSCSRTSSFGTQIRPLWKLMAER